MERSKMTARPHVTNFEKMRRTKGGRVFLESGDGQVFHEVSHYCAANEKARAVGHIIISDQTRAAAFVTHPMDLQSLMADTDRFQFTAAAAAVAEMRICDTTEINRASLDARNFHEYVNQQYTGTPEELTRTIRGWVASYGSRIDALSRKIQRTYDDCALAVDERRYLLRGYHVIPSAILAHGFFAKDDIAAHEKETISPEAMERALDSYLDAIGEHNETKNTPSTLVATASNPNILIRILIRIRNLGCRLGILK